MPEKYVKDLKAGDKTEDYEILSIDVQSDKVVAEVRFKDGGTSNRIWDQPNHIITTIPNLKKLEYGISPDREVAIAYGARAIYTGPGTCDLLWDRQDMQGGTPEQRKEFSKWLNEYGIPAIKKLTLEKHITTKEDCAISTSLHNWFINVNPRGSCGYLYIGVYPCDSGDPTFIPEPVPSPPTPKAKKVTVKKGNRR